MIKNILNELRISVIATVCLAVLLCGIYPAVVWLVAPFVGIKLIDMLTGILPWI